MGVAFAVLILADILAVTWTWHITKSVSACLLYALYAGMLSVMAALLFLEPWRYIEQVF